MCRPETIAEVADRRLVAPDRKIWDFLNSFLDAFYDVGGSAAMLAEEPSQALDREEAALLAGSVEYLSLHYGLECPAWTLKSRYFLRKACYPNWWRSSIVDAMCAIESPYAFRRRLVFVEAEPLRRKLGPRLRPMPLGATSVHDSPP